jgi:general stress protein 26
LAKIQSIAKDQTAMLCTFVDGNVLPRPMATSGIDQDGRFWFMSRKDSRKNAHIQANPKVQLMYSVGDKSEYLSVVGHAVVSHDMKKIEELWSPWAKTWFPGGPQDPDLTLIAVTPTGGYSWDTKHGRMVALLGMIVGAVTGKQTDDSVEGQLALS